MFIFLFILMLSSTSYAHEVKDVEKSVSSIRNEMFERKKEGEDEKSPRMKHLQKMLNDNLKVIDDLKKNVHK